VTQCDLVNVHQHLEEFIQKVMLPQTVGLPVCLGVKRHLGLNTSILLVNVGRLL
jgi:hypothetical protein